MLTKGNTNNCPIATRLNDYYNVINGVPFSALSTDERASLYFSVNYLWKKCGCSSCWINICSIASEMSQIGDDFTDFFDSAHQVAKYNASEFHPAGDDCSQGGMAEIWDGFVQDLMNFHSEYKDEVNPDAIGFVYESMAFRIVKSLLVDCGCCSCFHNSWILGQKFLTLNINIHKIVSEVEVLRYIKK